MKFNEDQILDYLDNRMSAQQRKQFDLELSQDETLREEVSFLNALRGGLQKYRDLEIRESIADIHQRLYATLPPYTKQRNSLKVILIIVLIGGAALLGTWFYLYKLHVPLSPEKLYEKYHETPRHLMASRETEDDVNLEDANDLFMKGHYNEAAVLLKISYKASPKEIRLMYYCGQCYMEQGDFANAIECFHILQSNVFYRSGANLNLALIYIKQGDIAMAKGLLLDVVKDNDGSTKVKAEKILADM